MRRVLTWTALLGMAVAAMALLGHLADPSVLARVLVRYDRYWPNVQDYEDSFTPAMEASLKNSNLPVLAFSSTNRQNSN